MTEFIEQGPPRSHEGRRRRRAGVAAGFLAMAALAYATGFTQGAKHNTAATPAPAATMQPVFNLPVFLSPIGAYQSPSQAGTLEGAYSIRCIYYPSVSEISAGFGPPLYEVDGIDKNGRPLTGYIEARSYPGIVAALDDCQH